MHTHINTVHLENTHFCQWNIFKENKAVNWHIKLSSKIHNQKENWLRNVNLSVHWHFESVYAQIESHQKVEFE